MAFNAFLIMAAAIIFLCKYIQGVFLSSVVKPWKVVIGTLLFLKLSHEIFFFGSREQKWINAYLV